MLTLMEALVHCRPGQGSSPGAQGEAPHSRLGCPAARPRRLRTSDSDSGSEIVRLRN